MAQNAKLKDTTRNLAKFTGQLAAETEQEFNRLHSLLDRTNEVLGAVVRLIGPEAVEGAVKEMREEAAALMLKKQKDGVAFLVEKGVMKSAEVVTAPDGYIVGTDTLADGTERRVQFEVAGIRPEFLPLYIGKKVGDVIEGNGAKLTIVEVYTLDRKKFEEVMAPKQPEVAPAQAPDGQPAQ